MDHSAWLEQLELIRLQALQMLQQPYVYHPPPPNRDSPKSAETNHLSPPASDDRTATIRAIHPISTPPVAESAGVSHSSAFRDSQQDVYHHSPLQLSSSPAPLDSATYVSAGAPTIGPATLTHPQEQIQSSSYNDATPLYPPSEYSEAWGNVTSPGVIPGPPHSSQPVLKSWPPSTTEPSISFAVAPISPTQTFDSPSTSTLTSSMPASTPPSSVPQTPDFGPNLHPQHPHHHHSSQPHLPQDYNSPSHALNWSPVQHVPPQSTEFVEVPIQPTSIPIQDQHPSPHPDSYQYQHSHQQHLHQHASHPTVSPADYTFTHAPQQPLIDYQTFDHGGTTYYYQPSGDEPGLIQDGRGELGGSDGITQVAYPPPMISNPTEVVGVPGYEQGYHANADPTIVMLPGPRGGVSPRQGSGPSQLLTFHGTTEHQPYDPYHQPTTQPSQVFSQGNKMEQPSVNMGGTDQGSGVSRTRRRHMHLEAHPYRRNQV